jgi:glucose/arabinose dehydrogenase
MSRSVRTTSCLVVLAAMALLLPATAWSQVGVNRNCPDENVFFNPGQGEDIYVPPGYKVSVFRAGLNFPTNIAFSGRGRDFKVYVTEAGTSLPGFCNGAVLVPPVVPAPYTDAENPFIADVRILHSDGSDAGFLGRSPSVATREDPKYLHAPTIGIAFERGFGGGRLFVTDSRQGIRGALGPKNSSRVVQLTATPPGILTELITNLPTGDHPTEQITVKDGYLYWSQGSVTNSGVVGHDNGAANCGVTPTDPACRFPNLVDTTTQQEIPCQDVLLSGNNSNSGDGHFSGGWLLHGEPGAAGQIVPAFNGAFQPGMCTGAILRAKLSNPQRTVEPVSWGYRNPFGIRFAPDDHPLKGNLLVSENGEDERGARPTNNAPDRLQVTPASGLDYHGWPDRFGFLNSTQAIFNPVGGPADDCAACAVGRPVLPLALFPPQQPKAPLAIEPTDVAAVGLDFAPQEFAGGGNRGETVRRGDALVTREGDFGFSLRNGTPIEGHDIERVTWHKDGNISLERFAFNCRAADQVVEFGRKRCRKAADQAFIDLIRGINRPVDGKFGPDGAFYLVDFGAVRDFGRSTSDERPAPATETTPGNSMFKNPAHAPLVQIPGTGVIWKIERIGGGRGDRDDRDDRGRHGRDDDDRDD